MISRALPYILVFVLGAVLAYYATPTKTITQVVESKEDKQLIADLQSKLQQKTQTKTITLYRDGVIDQITTDTTVDTTVDTTQQVKEETKIEVKDSTKVEINPKRYYIEVNYDSNKNYGFSTHYALFGPIHIGLGVASNLSTSTMFRVGLGFSF